MLRTPALLLLLGVLPCQPVPAQADEPKTADDVIAKYVEAIGGREKLDSVESMRWVAKITVMGGMEFPMTLELKRPNKMRSEITLQGMTIITAFDGETGWMINPMMGKTDPEKLPPDQVKAMKEQGDSLRGPLVDYKEKGHKVELMGREEIEGTEVYKLKFIRKGAASGEFDIYYIDAEYFLPIKAKGKRQVGGSEVESEVSLGDYKEVDGLIMPHSFTSTSSMGGGSLTIEKIELKVKLGDDRFTMPKVEKEKPAADKKEKAEAEKKEQPATKEKEQPVKDEG